MNKMVAGGRVRGVRMTTLERRIGRLMRSEDGHGDDGQGGGGAGAGAGADGDGGGEEAPKAWYDGQLSAEVVDDKTLPDALWMKNKGYDGLAATVKGFRALEAKLSNGNRIEVPGEAATDEQRAAFAKAIGVGENVDAYAFEAPEGWEADMQVLPALREAALKGGMPVAAWNAQVEAFKGLVMDQHNALVDGQNAERDALYKEWGAQKDLNTTLAQRGFDAFEIKPEEIQAMQTALGEGGTRRMLELGLKLGRMSGEDGFIPGGKKDFGIAPAEARSELARLEADREFIGKLRDKDPVAVARHERLLAIIAQDDAAREKAE